MNTEPVTIQITDAAGNLKTLAEIEREVIHAAVVKCTGNMAAAARWLGIGRSTIYRKIEG